MLMGVRHLHVLDPGVSTVAAAEMEQVPKIFHLNSH
jgi:hypothetical protein